jgi:hypothetical protein
MDGRRPGPRRPRSQNPAYRPTRPPPGSSIRAGASQGVMTWGNAGAFVVPCLPVRTASGPAPWARTRPRGDLARARGVRRERRARAVPSGSTEGRSVAYRSELAAALSCATAGKRGYDALLTHDSAQLDSVEESRAIRDADMHHIWSTRSPLVGVTRLSIPELIHLPTGPNDLHSPASSGVAGLRSCADQPASRACVPAALPERLGSMRLLLSRFDSALGAWPC